MHEIDSILQALKFVSKDRSKAPREREQARERLEEVHLPSFVVDISVSISLQMFSFQMKNLQARTAIQCRIEQLEDFCVANDSGWCCVCSL